MQSVCQIQCLLKSVSASCALARRVIKTIKESVKKKEKVGLQRVELHYVVSNNLSFQNQEERQPEL